ncbi:uncharacterized protein LOC105213272 [Zeugodacus cucurbitae]|uniref:30S ribosomal protein S17 n=1 Tax=Zeugodacus cucurbitae TaxID=28588 RepID=A0A0A1WWQ3_ZEUCU|nr:uncharacterized protein LOC105213272 [Zeugodacus cucurbitae]
MFASGSRTKNIIVRQSMTHRQLPLLPTAATPTTMTARTARRVSSTGDDTRLGATLSGRQLSPQVRSKFTERKATSMSATTTAAAHVRNAMQSSASNSNHPGLYKTSAHAAAAAAGSGSAQGDGRKVMRGIPSNTAARATARQRREAAAKGIDTTVKKSDVMEQIIKTEIGIQTNEPEILNHDLIIGDIKLLPPTACVVAEIERQRSELNKKLMLKTQRKFEGHSEKQEEHLTDLKEFLEKSVVTRRLRKSKLSIEVDKKLINSMDEILNRGVPKTESITDIKGRIKKKEQELLTLFDTVENLQV